MRKRLTTLLISLLIAVSLYSQEDYPKLIVLDGDTLVAFTNDQVDKINLTFVYLDKEKELNSVYQEENRLLNEELLLTQDKNSTCQQKNEKLLEVNNEKESQVQILTSENKKQGKKIVLLKKMRNLYGIGGVAIGSGITYFLTQILKQ